MPVRSRADLLQPKVAKALTEGGVSSVARYVSLVRWMSLAVVHGKPRERVLSRVAQECMLYFRKHQHETEPLRALSRAVAFPLVRPDFVRFWFGRLKGFGRIDELVTIATGGKRVEVTGEGDLAGALAYGNHSSVQTHNEFIVAKIFDDVRSGRAFALPRSVAVDIPGLRLSPLVVVASPRKIRLVHDLSVCFSPEASSVINFGHRAGVGTTGRDWASTERRDLARSVLAQQVWGGRGHLFE